MTISSWKSWLPSAALALAVLVGAPLSAQEKSKEKKKPNPALPPFVGQVVNDEQKAQMVKIAEGYEPELDKLRAEIRKLNAELQKISKKRDGEILELLTAEQKSRIQALAAAAKAKSDANKKAKDSAKDKPSDKPPEKAPDPKKESEKS